jgi:aminoglycoside/choline kinase family phosphotransferase
LLLREMELLPEWFLQRHLGLTIAAGERTMLERLFDSLVSAALAQPATFVHRDYHSRNLLVTPRNNPGILDFQDAVWGPVTYDLASLLKDCYIDWPPARVREWVLDYRERLLAAGFALRADPQQFMHWFDLMGLQRHIKVLGIFARLFYRDGKSQYLRDLPRVLDYARDTAARYAETEPFADFIVKRIDPVFGDAQRRALT